MVTNAESRWSHGNRRHAGNASPLPDARSWTCLHTCWSYRATVEVKRHHELHNSTPFSHLEPPAQDSGLVHSSLVAQFPCIGGWRETPLAITATAPTAFDPFQKCRRLPFQQRCRLLGSIAACLLHSSSPGPTVKIPSSSSASFNTRQAVKSVSSSAGSAAAGQARFAVQHQSSVDCHTHLSSDKPRSKSSTERRSPVRSWESLHRDLVVGAARRERNLEQRLQCALVEVFMRLVSMQMFAWTAPRSILSLWEWPPRTPAPSGVERAVSYSPLTTE